MIGTVSHLRPGKVNTHRAITTNGQLSPGKTRQPARAQGGGSFFAAVSARASTLPGVRQANGTRKIAQERGLEPFFPKPHPTQFAFDRIGDRREWLIRTTRRT